MGLLGGQVAAQPNFIPDPSSLELIAEHEALVAGQVNTIALAFELKSGWHIYFDGQNDTGFTPDPGIAWPEGWKVEPPREPTPIRYESAGGILDHVLEGSPTILLPVWIPESAAGTTVTLNGNASWLVCKDACLLDDEQIQLTLPVVAAGETVSDSSDAVRIRAARDTLAARPKGLPEWLTASWDGTNVRLNTELAGTLEFYPASKSITVENLLQDGSATTGGLSLRTQPADAGDVLRGIVSVIAADGSRTSSWIKLTPEG